MYVKRDDLIHPEVSGNKWRKLRYNVAKALQQGNDTLLTLGGAHSNHIAATAAVGAMFGIKTIGIIRGEEADFDNPTLSFAIEQGMSLNCISREAYQQAHTWDFQEELKAQHGHFYFIPQGGANAYGIHGCMDILKEIEVAVDKVFVAMGTATTVSGMALANTMAAQIYGVPALKGGAYLLDELRKNVASLIGDPETEADLLSKVHILDGYHFGGYAKVTHELLQFMRSFYNETGIKLDPVYTAKCAFAMCDFAAKSDGKHPQNWLFIHTGGMQGLPAMEQNIGYEIYPDC